MENSRIGLSIRAIIDLDPQTFSRFSPAYQPLCRRISTAFSTGFSPQIRSISAGFAHREAAGFFRIFFAAIAQEIADSSEEKNGEKQARSNSLRKSRSRCGG